MRDVINKMGNFINQTNESMLIRIFDVTSIERWLLDKISNYSENNYSSIKFQNYFLYSQKTKCYLPKFFSQVLEWFILYTYRVISPLFEYFKLFRLRVFSYLCVFCFSLHCASSSLLASSLKSKGSLNSSPSSSSLKTPDSDPGKEATGKEEEVDIEEPDSLPPGPPAVRSAPYQVCIGPPSVSALCLYVHEGGVSFIHSIQLSAVLVWAAW